MSLSGLEGVTAAVATEKVLEVRTCGTEKTPVFRPCGVQVLSERGGESARVWQKVWKIRSWAAMRLDVTCLEH